jgi:mannose-6-phosphate isomerase
MAKLPDALIDAARARDELKSWLLNDAYPLWWSRGIDRTHGGFVEVLDQSGQAPLAVPRRSRVQPRQVYTFAMAGPLGWNGDAHGAIDQGLKFYLEKHRRADGFFNAVVGADGATLDNRANLYDQAFALFGLAAAHSVSPHRSELREIALQLREALRVEIESPGSLNSVVHSVAPGALPGASANADAVVVSSNAFMHLFEASLAWHEADGDSEWLVMADHIVTIAMSRFIDPRTGAVREFFNRDWTPAAGIAGRLVEPGHQYEWAWLLLRWCARAECDDAAEAAMRLIEIAEAHGVDARRGAVIGSLLEDFSVHDPVARLWPQTERIKAACLAAVVTKDERYWKIALDAINGLRRYLQTPVRGLWRDRRNADGVFVDEPAPASSFYHIVCALVELDRTIASSDWA